MNVESHLHEVIRGVMTNDAHFCVYLAVRLQISFEILIQRNEMDCSTS